jgi:co-chaperonin GroES (HSP10)
MRTIRPCHELAFIRPRPDIHDRMLGMTMHPTGYRVTARRDQFAIGQVIALGTGTPYGSGRDRPEVDAGMIVGFDLGQVGHILPNGLWTLIWKQMLCVFGADQQPTPLSSWVMTRADDTAIARLMLAEDSRLVLPGMAASDGVVTSDVRKTRVKLRAEVVEAVGRGDYVRKVFVETGCKRHDIACFTPGATVHLQWRDRRLAFTPWSEIVCVIDAA